MFRVLFTQLLAMDIMNSLKKMQNSQNMVLNLYNYMILWRMMNLEMCLFFLTVCLHELILFVKNGLIMFFMDTLRGLHIIKTKLQQALEILIIYMTVSILDM